MSEYEKIVDILKKKKKTISFMESCTGGFLSNLLTNVEGASMVFSFGAVTYSNDYKLKLGVDKKIIDTYTVYSIETAKEMAKSISLFASANYGVGITGKMGVSDPANPYGDDSTIYISIYDRDKNTYITQTMTIKEKNRMKEKEAVAILVGFLLLKYLNA